MNFKVRVSFVILSVSKMNSNPTLQTYLFLKSLSLPDIERISGNAIALCQKVYESLKTHLGLSIPSKLCI